MAINYHDGGSNSPYVPDFTNVNVEPADLAEFADLLDGDLLAIRDAWESMRNNPQFQSYPNFPGEHSGEFNYATGYPVYGGSDGILEAREFSAAYLRTLDAERRLMVDLIRGLETLRDAARMIHDGYISSDATNAGDLDDAFAAYERSSVIEALGDPDRVEGHEAEA
jgi:hypothetical protein